MIFMNVTISSVVGKIKRKNEIPRPKDFPHFTASYLTLFNFDLFVRRGSLL